MRYERQQQNEINLFLSFSIQFNLPKIATDKNELIFIIYFIHFI